MCVCKKKSSKRTFNNIVFLLCISNQKKRMPPAPNSIPVTAYEPSRRIFIGGLPPTATSKDVIAIIKQRTRAQPTHVEIALDKKVVNPNQQQQRDPYGPAPRVTRVRKPKIKIPGCSSSSDDDEILALNKKNALLMKQHQEGTKENTNKNNENDDDSDGEGDAKNNNKKKAGDNKDKAEADKKPLRACRGFAHATVEGLKAVIETMKGAAVNDKQIFCTRAKSHYLWRNERAKREREKEEEKKADAVNTVTGKEGYGELDYTKPPIRSHNAAKKKFGNIASEIAARLRKNAKERKEKQKMWQKKFGGGGAAQGGNNFDRRRQRENDDTDKNKKVPQNSADAKKNLNNNNNKKRGKPVARDAAPPPPPPPPEPTKQDRKLSALEARLAALQAKLKKK